MIYPSSQVRFFEEELAFTQAYLQNIDQPAAVREARCLEVQFPAIFSPIREKDLLAGRIDLYPPVGFGMEQASGGPGFYCYEDQVREKMKQMHLNEAETAVVEEMMTFWQKEKTIEGKLIARLPEEILRVTSNSVADMFGRLSGAVIDFEKLVKVGLPGLRTEVAQSRERAAREGGDTSFLDGAEIALDLFERIIRDYAAQARSLAEQAAHAKHALHTVDEAREEDLLEMAAALEKVASEPPETLREAAQLAWLYALISGVVNYGRMDVYLGDFYVRDLQANRLTEASALRLVQSLWQLMADRKIIFNGRVFIGGYGRPNEANANRFALLAMEATRTVIEIEPQLTLRWYEGMPAALWEKALEVIGEGRTFPMLFNDDVNVPAVMKGFNVERAAAEQYLPYGCGEYALDHIGFGSPNCSLNLLKALEAVLHNGRDAQTGKVVGLNTGSLADFATYDDLWNAYRKQVQHYVVALADRHALEYKAEAESAGFLYVSMLYDDCIARSKSLVNGGVRYRGGVIETFGIVNTADSLAAIKRLVYDQKRMTLEQFVTVLDADFEGCERERRLILAAPKYGNDDDYVDSIVQAVSDHVSRFTYEQAARVGFQYFLIVNINNYANVSIGKTTAASGDGRRNSAPLANGNTPTAGNDTCGVTAFLNSIVKLDPSAHAGYTHNMKFSKQMFREERAKVSALLKAYFGNGGTQAMITVVGRGDMEAALREPEKYRNLIVRVGGFSARFVELENAVQMDLIQRTLY
jgi:pyruvate-formate lyase